MPDIICGILLIIAFCLCRRESNRNAHLLEMIERQHAMQYKIKEDWEGWRDIRERLLEKRRSLRRVRKKLSENPVEISQQELDRIPSCVSVGIHTHGMFIFGMPLKIVEDYNNE